MRLLHFNALGRLILTDFRGKPIPPYAILSHRWSDSETLIEDIRNEGYKEKEEGYRKLKFCAKQAAKDGLQYFWIDTCCINRWDNNERSKAINSMFQWYKNAARCYVFLSDVSVSSATDASQRNSWEASFRGSDWFTRGWLLQELIAPVSVEFFSGEGHYLGDKTSLEQLLHNITNIPLAVLRNCPLEQFSISERMQWAKNRRTTEEEDIVYCLLGLLGVSMPTRYGEGKESALRRLQAEVEGVGSAPSIIPFSRNESFVGREAQLAELEAKLFSNDQTTTTLAILGPGGAGKSQLALEVAHRTRLSNKNCSVFWIDASDIDSLYRSYASVAQKLSIPGCEDDQADIKQVVKRCVAVMSARQCLLIYDNVEDTTLWPSGSSTTRAADLTDFLPHSKLCSVIFTTIQSNTAEVLAPQNVTALHELTPDSALGMLQNLLTTPLSNVEQQEAMHLLKELSYLPLAVVQAAACMNASSITVQQYQAQLAEHKEAALEYSDGSSEGKQLVSGLRKTVAATLSLSVSKVRQSNAVAADYLFIAACVDRKDILLDLLEAASPQVREDAVKVLDKYALVTRRPAECALDVHQVVHQALRKQLQVQGQLVQWTQHTITQVLQVFPNDDYSNRSKWRRLLPHAQCALSHSLADANNKERLDLASKCARTLYSDGQYKEAEKLYVQVIQARKRVLGKKHPSTLSSMANLASTYRDQGRWKEAEELEVQVMEARKRVLRPEHSDKLISIDSPALVLTGQDKYREAEKLTRRALEGQEKTQEERHPQMLKSVSRLAAFLQVQHEYKEAEERFGEHCEALPVFVGQASARSGTYIGQGSIGLSQDETLVGQEEPTIMPKKQNVEVPDDSSTASHTTTGRERLGKTYVARFLAADVEMHTLCSRVLDRVGQEQFVDVGRRMLKDFHLGLLEHAKSELEKEGARLMKSRSGRRRICKDIANIIKSEKAQNEEEKARSAEQLRLTEKRLEMFTKDFPDTCPDPEPDQPGEDEGNLSNDYDIIGLGEQDNTSIGQEQDEGVFPDRGLESELESEDDDLPKLTKMKEFFRESEPFQMLLNDLRMELLPQSLRDVMQTAPHDSLLLSNQHDDSLCNRMKAFIEDFTMLKWNWWPLEPRKRKLSSNELRLSWHCSCGTQLWQEISFDDANLIKPMLVNRTASLGSQRCKQNRGLSSLVTKCMAFTAPWSAAGRRYTPSNITDTSDSATQGSQGTSGRPGPNNLPNPTQATNQVAGSGTNINVGQQATSSDLRILFGVKGPDPALKLEQIEITDTMNDSNFYDELQKHYRLNRGKFRYWFSFWRLGYCEVVKFATYRPDYVLKKYRELPTSDDYEYSPRPPDKAPNPPVSQHEFSMHLNACGDCCHWTLLTNFVPVLGSLLHGCLPRLHTTRAIERIPKKKSPFDTSSTDDKDAYAWGLEAGHEISAAHVAFYHFVILALPFGFWGWWQATHPGDLQNASVPMSIVLTMLSLFWGTNGILTQGRRSTVTGI